jgi:hypothetical protein
MLKQYMIENETIDSLELKILMITRGINIKDDTLYHTFGKTHRLSSSMDPQACNCLLLPDQTIVHMINTGESSPFEIGVNEKGKPFLSYNDNFLTEVSFPPKTAFYDQETCNGFSFGHIAVLQGLDVLSFPYLWVCEYAKAGYPCQFCFPGAFTHKLVNDGNLDPQFPDARDVAEVVHFAVNTEQVARFVQITGGSSMNPLAECRQVAEILNAIDGMAGLENIQGEILIYTSPPEDPKTVDIIFESGADRIACDIEVWDETLVKTICPGKDKFTGRKRQLKTLEYIAEKYGPNKACSAFIVGVEPAESFLSAAQYLAERGIIPIASIWIPHGKPVLGKTKAPGLDFYRRLKENLADIYIKYNCEPPGNEGFNVCLCRDVWNHRETIQQRSCACIPSYES